jgi:hypothetical protein
MWLCDCDTVFAEKPEALVMRLQLRLQTTILKQLILMNEL